VGEERRGAQRNGQHDSHTQAPGPTGSSGRVVGRSASVDEGTRNGPRERGPFRYDR
jgi:hypothetical protein